MPSNPDSTLYIGNLDERVDERTLYEIMIQGGPVIDVYIPRDKETKRHKGYAFAEFKSEESAQYALKLFSNLLCLYNRPIRLSISGQDKPTAIDDSKSTPLRRPSETNITQRNFTPATSPCSPFTKSGNGYPGPALSTPNHYMSASVHAQSYNSGLVSLREWNMRSHVPRQGYHYAQHM